MSEGATLITGASGFVGKALARALMAEGKTRVVGMVRDVTLHSRPHAPPVCDVLVRGDVRDDAVFRRVLADYEIGTVYHLAAESIVSACAEDPLGALETAVMGTGRLLQAVRDTGRPIAVVVSASDKVYGDAPSPYTEATPLDARHAYEVSKACQDLVSRMYFHNYGVDVRVARAVNIYGPGDPNETRIIPRTIRRVLAGEPPLLHAGASEMRRQYVYIDDLVKAFRVIRELGTRGEAYCVGSPDPAMSVREVMEEIVMQAGKARMPPEVREREARFREIQEQSIDDRKLRALGWSPMVRFREGIQRTGIWYRAGGAGI